MASRSQGITVEIGGDTTKLSTALSKANKEIRDTQAQLKDVNKLLKLDPGNAELMAQKQRLLARAVGETREKLDALRLAGQQANEALAKGEISQSQYDALQGEIVETEQALRDLERQAEQASVALQKIGADVGSLRAELRRLDEAKISGYEDYKAGRMSREQFVERKREYRETLRIREYLHLEGYDKRVMASLIESAKVMGEDRLEVVWKFGDVYEKILGEMR